MSESCYVIERLHWNEVLDGSGNQWANRNVCRVFRKYEDAKEFVEKDAVLYIPMKWAGAYRYAGRTVIDGSTEIGLMYLIHYLPVS